MANREEMTAMLFEMLKNKTGVLEMLNDSIKQVNTIKNGVDRMKEQVEEHEEVNIKKSLTTLLSSMKMIAKANEQMLVLLILYVSEGEFDLNAAMMLNKLGKGEEAVKEMWEKKLRGG